MGIRGLFTELSRKGYEGESICLSAPEHRRRTIVVDASALIEEFSEGWEYSGNFVEVFNKVKEFVVRFRKAGISLVAVTDGAVMT